ncbi:hypothetical protein BU26DRAFT_404715, partial [Trematosphaeria pertusa]
PRRPIIQPPLPGKVYYMPDGRHVPPSSVIHGQKRQDGFFKHPILSMGMSHRGKYVHFYAMTRIPPVAIWDLGMCLRLGNTMADEGDLVLKLAKGSRHMQHQTWVNLEQRFYIEWQHLDHWACDVCIDPEEFIKLNKKVAELEAQQNRFIYKPLRRDLSHVELGSVVMLPNPSTSQTLGAPALVLQNHYPHFRFLRIKAILDNSLQEGSSNRKAHNRSHCLEISRYPKAGHHGAPVLLLELDSPDMR